MTFYLVTKYKFQTCLQPVSYCDVRSKEQAIDIFMPVVNKDKKQTYALSDLEFPSENELIYTFNTQVK